MTLGMCGLQARFLSTFSKHFCNMEVNSTHWRQQLYFRSMGNTSSFCCRYLNSVAMLWVNKTGLRMQLLASAFGSLLVGSGTTNHGKTDAESFIRRSINVGLCENKQSRKRFAFDRWVLLKEELRFRRSAGSEIERFYLFYRSFC